MSMFSPAAILTIGRGPRKVPPAGVPELERNF